MAAIFQTTLLIAFSWMNMCEFWLRFHWSLFLRVKLTILQHWFRQWLGAVQATSHCLNQWWLVTDAYMRHSASMSLIKLLRYNYDVWRHRAWSTLVQVMACCLTAPNDYLNQCWLITNDILWHSPEGRLTGDVQYMHPWYEIDLI